MKFSHSLQFNAVPDWAPYYLSYSSLKKLIYQIERDLFGPSASISDLANSSEESQSLLDFKARANALFLPALDKELEKIVAFYYKKERELLSECESLQADVAFIENYEATFAYNSPMHFEEASGSPSPLRSPRTPKRSNTFDPARAAGLSSLWKSGRPHRTLTGSASSPLLSDHDEQNAPFTAEPASNEQRIQMSFENNNPPLASPSGSVPVSPSHSIWAGNAQESLQERRSGFRVRAIDVFVLLSELKSFVSLNHTGFTKILKKYDKITGNDLKKSYLNTVVAEAYPFKAENLARLDETIQKVEMIYSRIACFGNQEHAIRELKSHLREHIVWERNTVWRDMIGIERKSTAVNVRNKEVPAVGAGMENNSSFVTFSAVINRSTLILAFCIVVFVVLLNVETFETVEERNCLAILVLASLMWATEVIPLFVTSLVIPFLVIVLRVLRDDTDHSRLTPKLATKKIFAAMFSPVIMLLLGGFAIAAALSKFHIAKAMATWVLSRAGTKPSRVLFANMLVATLLSMWISNVAAPVLCFSLIQPILRTLPGGSTYARSLIMGIALASNIGGMASPISSPQNIIAIDNMDPSPSWAEWFFVTLPIALMSDVLVWLLLLWIYNPTSGTAAVHAIRQTEEPVTWTQIFVCAVTVSTVFLWCFESQLDGYLGDMGVVAIFPLIAFFGMGILTKDEFNSFPWTVIVLAMGGISLGKAVESSGLLFTIAHHIQQFVVGFTTFQVLAVFVCLMMVVATFLSHTVSALIILPIVAEVGANMADPRPRLLVMGSALMCSGAMGLPMSGFPNMNAIMLEDEMGAPYLTTTDFLKAGVPGTVLVGGLVVTVGYLLMDLLHW